MGGRTCSLSFGSGHFVQNNLGYSIGFGYCNNGKIAAVAFISSIVYIGVEQKTVLTRSRQVSGINKYMIRYIKFN